MKRFSVKWFVIVTLLHIFGTILLIDAGFAELRAMNRAIETGQPEESFLWLAVWSWIWQPVNMLASYYTRHHPPPVSSGALFTGWVPAANSYIFAFRGRSSSVSVSAFSLHGCGDGDIESSNQSMKPTAPLRNNFRVFATTPCRGLSLSR